MASSDGGSPFLRKRKCHDCGRRFKTLESHIGTEVDEYIRIIAGVAEDKLVDKILQVINSEKFRTVLTSELRKAAGASGRHFPVDSMYGSSKNRNNTT